MRPPSTQPSRMLAGIDPDWLGARSAADSGARREIGRAPSPRRRSRPICSDVRTRSDRTRSLRRESPDSAVKDHGARSGTALNRTQPDSSEANDSGSGTSGLANRDGHKDRRAQILDCGPAQLGHHRDEDSRWNTARLHPNNCGLQILGSSTTQVTKMPQRKRGAGGWSEISP